jgi:hypothetical protein
VNRLVSNIILAICFCFIFIICFPTTSYAQEAWDTLETDCCTIFYFDEGHLEDFALRIDAVKYTSNGFEYDSLNTGARVDEVMDKVQYIMDTYLNELDIALILLPDYQSLGEAFREFSQSEHIPLAFYSHKTESIYIDVSSITSGVLAHEMAHAVINHYFSEPPPAKMQEILAQYVDMHLWD